MHTRDTESLDRCLSLSLHLFKPFKNYYFLKFVTWLKALSTAVRRDGAVKIFSQSLLFNLRCKSQNEFLSNFSSSTEIIPCKICQKHQDTQEHALFCEKLKLYMTIENIDNYWRMLNIQICSVMLMTSSSSQMFFKQSSPQGRKYETLLERAYLGLVQGHMTCNCNISHWNCIIIKGCVIDLVS